MKKKFAALFAPMVLCFFLTIEGFAQQQNMESDKYCTVLKDGVMLLMKDGIISTTQISLRDGSTVSKDGSVRRKDGSNIILKNGECIDMDGNIENIPLEKAEQKNNIIRKSR